MPIYEMIILCRIGDSQAIGLLMKSLVTCIYQEGGVVRRFVNLGDRISEKSYQGKDGLYHPITRYLTCEFDANPDSKNVAEKVAQGNVETLKVFVHKLKEKDYYKHVLNKDAWREFEYGKEFKKLREDMVKAAAKQRNDLEKSDPDLEKKINEETDWSDAKYDNLLKKFSNKLI